MSKYFVVENFKIAEIMRMLLEESYCTFEQDGKTKYTFKRTKNINVVYGKAKTIMELF